MDGLVADATAGQCSLFDMLFQNQAMMRSRCGRLKSYRMMQGVATLFCLFSQIATARQQLMLHYR